jgi:hypothetical protein
MRQGNKLKNVFDMNLTPVLNNSAWITGDIAATLVVQLPSEIVLAACFRLRAAQYMKRDFQNCTAFGYDCLSKE